MARLYLLIMLILIPISSLFGQTKKALLVGISEYTLNDSNTDENTWTNIHGANDVSLLTTTLKSQGFNI